jgi:hypothetical protein
MRQLVEPSFAPGVEFPPETGCILAISRSAEVSGVLLVREVLAPGEGDLRETSAEGLVFSSRYLRRAMLRVREGRFDGFLTVHTHPLSETAVAFSPYDDLNDPPLMENLQELGPGSIFGSLVLGRHAASGRVWCRAERRLHELRKIAVMGESFRFAANTQPVLQSAVLGLFDRSLALTGVGALATLAQMRVAIVGAGGTGSLMAELLARAGAGEVTIFDFDASEPSNLNRVLHLRANDVERGDQKALRISEAIAELGLPTKISASSTGGDVRTRASAIELADFDLLVSCVDRDWPRLVISEVAYQFLVPVVDLGTEITAHEGQIQSIDARASISGPGRPCLLCAGVISAERVRLEGLADAEKQRQIDTGYSPNIRLKAPAVMDLNMRAASMAMLIIRHLLQPFLATPLAHSYRETVTSFAVRPLRFQPRRDCPVCDPQLLGKGDASSFTTRRTCDVDQIAVASKH